MASSSSSSSSSTATSHITRAEGPEVLEQLLGDGHWGGDDSKNKAGCLDLRLLPYPEILSRVEQLSALLPRVEQVWLPEKADGDADGDGDDHSSFLELRGRLKAKLKERNQQLEGEPCNRLLLKLARVGTDVDEGEATGRGQKLQHLGEAMEDMSALSSAHPGLVAALLTTCKHISRSRRRKDATATVATARAVKRKYLTYGDGCAGRRQSRVTLRTWKSFVGDTKAAASSTRDYPHHRNFCYVCKSGLAGAPPPLCEGCRDTNMRMREWSADLDGKYAVVTGARIKIGLEVALRLLRDGCFVVATTRFPRNALIRYQKEADYDRWKHRLRICHLELEDLTSVEAFLDYCREELPHLDILINNAAQTIQRPREYYRSLERAEAAASAGQLADSSTVLALEQPREDGRGGPCGRRLTWASDSRQESLFPPGKLDRDGEQLDLRPRNSWTYNLGEVPLGELLQVLAVNAVGPALLAARLKPMLTESPGSSSSPGRRKRRFVVNVSAMEGQFSRAGKSHRHPHTNMAKAALNMLTRTSGMEFEQDGIYMTSVDTGWVTDERPHAQAAHEARRGFETPLDCRDGAARVLHPIYHGMKEENQPYFAVFLKDFRVHPW